MLVFDSLEEHFFKDFFLSFRTVTVLLVISLSPRNREYRVKALLYLMMFELMFMRRIFVQKLSLKKLSWKMTSWRTYRRARFNTKKSFKIFETKNLSGSWGCRCNAREKSSQRLLRHQRRLHSLVLTGLDKCFLLQENPAPTCMLLLKETMKWSKKAEFWAAWVLEKLLENWRSSTIADEPLPSRQSPREKSGPWRERCFSKLWSVLDSKRWKIR